MSELTGPLGLCIKAGACTFGFDGTLNMLRKRKSFLVLVSADASDRTKKSITDKCKSYGTQMEIIDLSKTLASLKIKGAVKIISINDLNFKKLIDKRLKGET